MQTLPLMIFPFSPMKLWHPWLLTNLLMHSARFIDQFMTCQSLWMLILNGPQSVQVPVFHFLNEPWFPLWTHYLTFHMGLCKNYSHTCIAALYFLRLYSNRHWNYIVSQSKTIMYFIFDSHTLTYTSLAWHATLVIIICKKRKIKFKFYLMIFSVGLHICSLLVPLLLKIFVTMAN